MNETKMMTLDVAISVINPIRRALDAAVWQLAIDYANVYEVTKAAGGQLPDFENSAAFAFLYDALDDRAYRWFGLEE